MPDYVYSIAQNNTTEIEYLYDSLGRLESRVLSVPNLYTNYYYTNSAEDYSTSTQIKLITTSTEDFLYNYDAVGNITQMYKDMVLTESYTYDGLNQLKTATVNGKTYAYTYDGGGNILTATEDGTSHTYTYGNTAWKDQLTAYDGQTITYDYIGNPLTYRGGLSFTWQNGRQLASATKSGVTTSYTYNGDGTRNTKTVDNTTTQYYYVNGRLQALTKDIYTAFFLYDDTGRPYAIRLTIQPAGSTTPHFVMAYYKYNLQGDVVGLYSSSGQEFVTYTYDPWGKVLSAEGVMSTLITINPFRYRGYIYDDETGLYYCNSRYYDPETGRWINADGFVSTGQGVLGYNMYAYCKNSPVLYCDPTGCFSFECCPYGNCPYCKENKKSSVYTPEPPPATYNPQERTKTGVDEDLQLIEHRTSITSIDSYEAAEIQKQLETVDFWISTIKSLGTKLPYIGDVIDLECFISDASSIGSIYIAHGTYYKTVALYQSSETGLYYVVTRTQSQEYSTLDKGWMCHGLGEDVLALNWDNELSLY